MSNTTPKKRAPKRKNASDLAYSGHLKKQFPVVQTDIPGSRKLAVVKQPNPEFYKDEGGKSNYLTTTITLLEYDENGKLTRTPNEAFVSLPLRVSLYFESESRVEDRDQDILRFVGNEYDKIEIRGDNRNAVVKFRLEKVSRRKDGQRFKLKIEVDPEKAKGHPWTVNPAFTNPICVLSKRKNHTDSHKLNKAAPPRVSADDLARFEARMSARFEALQGSINQLVTAFQIQADTINTLQSIIGSTAAFRPGIAMNFDASMIKKSADRVPISPCSPKSFLTEDSDYHPNRIEPDFLADDDGDKFSFRKATLEGPQRFPRIAPAEMQFNFGVPSSPVSYAIDGTLIVE